MDKPRQQDYKIMSLEKALRELLEMTREYHAEGTVSQRWFTEATCNAEAALKDPMNPLVPMHEALIDEHEAAKDALLECEEVLSEIESTTITGDPARVRAAIQMAHKARRAEH